MKGERDYTAMIPMAAALAIAATCALGMVILPKEVTAAIYNYFTSFLPQQVLPYLH